MFYKLMAAISARWHREVRCSVGRSTATTMGSCIPLQLVPTTRITDSVCTAPSLAGDDRCNESYGNRRQQASTRVAGGTSLLARESLSRLYFLYQPSAVRRLAEDEIPLPGLDLR
jgi:hypothetical protein